MSEQLTVAINAQISLRHPGGSETNLLSLIQALGRVDSGDRFLVLGHRNFGADLIPFLGSNQTLMNWPFEEIGFLSLSTMVARAAPLGPRAQRLHAKVGVLGPGVTAAHQLCRMFQLVFRRNPPVKQVDSTLRARGVSVVHFPYAVCFRTTLPFVYEPWDLQHRHHPQFFSVREWSWRDRLYQEMCRKAKVVITATRWTKRDIVEQYGIPATKIAVIPRASLRVRDPLPPMEKADAWRRHRIPPEFALYPAMTFPHKNHLRLFQALAGLRDRYGITLPLVCTGRIYAPYWPKLEAELNRLRLQNQVHFLGVVSDGMLATLFQSARLMVFPSLFEGLGLPILEAMHHGLPILASNATCIPEVARDAAMLFDGTSVDSIVDALAGAVRSPDTIERLRSRGTRILSRFSWEKAARTFIACYRFAGSEPLSEDQQGLLAEAMNA